MRYVKRRGRFIVFVAIRMRLRCFACVSDAPYRRTLLCAPRGCPGRGRAQHKSVPIDAAYSSLRFQIFSNFYLFFFFRRSPPDDALKTDYRALSIASQQVCAGSDPRHHLCHESPGRGARREIIRATGSPHCARQDDPTRCAVATVFVGFSKDTVYARPGRIVRVNRLSRVRHVFDNVFIFHTNENLNPSGGYVRTGCNWSRTLKTFSGDKFHDDVFIVHAETRDATFTTFRILFVRRRFFFKHASTHDVISIRMRANKCIFEYLYEMHKRKIFGTFQKRW